MSIGKKLSAVLAGAPVVLALLATCPPASASTAARVNAAAAAGTAAAGKRTGGTVYERQVAKLPARFTRQKLRWTPCDARIRDAQARPFWRGARCALLTAPLDYAKPNWKSIKIAIDEVVPARGKTRRETRGDRYPGILMTNPGGPGGAGLWMAPFLANGTKPLHEHYDILGMNPRGVGPSTDASGNSDVEVMGLGATTLTCVTRHVTYQPPTLPGWASPALRALADQAKGQEAACQKNADGIRRYITTMNTARDMDLLRLVLREQKISYYGVSYGTFLGAMYGAMFPHNLDRMVLDGSMSPVTSWYAESSFDNAAKMLNFDAFAAWAVANHQGLGDTPRAVRATVDSLYTDVEKSAPQSLGGYTPGKLSKDVGEFTRYRPDWVQFADSLRNALAADRGGRTDSALTQDVDSASALVPAPSDITPEGEADFSDGVYNAVTCDWAWPKPDEAGYQVYNDGIVHWEKTFPYAGTVPAAGPSACTYLSYRPLEKLPVIRSRGAYPKGLVVNADGDTQTPLSMAKQMAKTLRFDLITITNDGTHGSAFAGNKCVDDAVTGYLVSGKLPGNITCPTIKPPGSAASLTSEAGTVAAQDDLGGDADQAGH
jgi:pimeloyl-ACP methyl ester carboxylesterase